MKLNVTMMLYAVSVPVVFMAATCIRAEAQGLYTGLTVNLPYTVSVGKLNLQPGEYQIERMNDLPFLAIYGDHGRTFETLAWISRIPITPSSDSAVVLLRNGDRYTLDSIRVQGEDEGFRVTPAGRQKAYNTEASNYVTLHAKPVRGN
jgi:hypothetical protein